METDTDTAAVEHSAWPLRVQHAHDHDVADIVALNNMFAPDGLTLHRSEAFVVSHLQDYQVVRGADGVRFGPVERGDGGLLVTLLANAGKVATHRQLMREVWGPGHAEQGHYLRIYVGRLRQKLESDPAQPKHLLTETGVGYRFQS